MARTLGSSFDSYSSKFWERELQALEDGALSNGR